MNKNLEVHQGEVVLVVLIATNALEYWFATVITSYPVMLFTMALLAAIDVALILEYYMHLPRVFSPGAGGHE